MRQRTPRPDILSVPPNNNYYDGLKEAESKVRCPVWFLTKKKIEITKQMHSARLIGTYLDIKNYSCFDIKLVSFVIAVSR